MRIAVFSDTHGYTAPMADAVARFRPDAVFHLGDHDRDTEVLLRQFPEIPLYNVAGNCDFAALAPNVLTVSLGPVKAFLTHGHLYHVDYGRVDSLVYAAQEEGCRLALFGHTHGGQIFGLSGLLDIAGDVDDRYLHGLLTENRSTLLISNGVGTSVIPARVFCPPQIHCIDISLP